MKRLRSRIFIHNIGLCNFVNEEKLQPEDVLAVHTVESDTLNGKYILWYWV